MRVLRYLAKMAPQVFIHLNVSYDNREHSRPEHSMLVYVGMQVIVDGRVVAVTHHCHDGELLWCSIPLADFDHRVFRDEYRHLIQTAACRLQERLQQLGLHNWLIERQLNRIVRVLEDREHLQRLSANERSAI